MIFDNDNKMLIGDPTKAYNTYCYINTHTWAIQYLSMHLHTKYLNLTLFPHSRFHPRLGTTYKWIIENKGVVI